MRFETLDILRYGALTGRRIDFRPGAKLHLVYGANEAGKSSALHAISDLLFGFPWTTAHYSFLHDPASLRIGAVLTSRAGEKIAFRRKRGKKNTLLAADDTETALRDDALSPFLGGLSREVFERAFGLDSERLREGGKAMLQSGGEIGGLLFSAASGLLGLTQLRKTLEEEAGGIFGQRRRQDHLFYQAVDRHDEARRAERENELRSGDWKRLVAETQELEGGIAALKAERQETKTALERLKTLKKLQPLIAEIDRELLDLETYADLAGVPDGFARQLADGLARRAAVAGALHTAESDVVRLRAELTVTKVDEPVLHAAAGIMAIFSETGKYTKAKQDLPAIDRELFSCESSLVQLARKLGLGGAAELEQRQPADADLVRLRRLVEDGRQSAGAIEDLLVRQAEERQQLEALDAGGETRRLIDPKPYAEQLAALSADLAELGREDALTVQVGRAEQNLGEAIGRLRPAIADLDGLLAAPLPDMAALVSHRQAIAAAETAYRDAAGQAAAIETEHDDLSLRIAQAGLEGPIVTLEDIRAARMRRDEALAAGDASGTSGAAAALVAEADRLADMALANVERLSRYHENLLRRDRLDRDLERARRHLAGRLADLEAARNGFALLFEASGVPVLAPELMPETMPELMIEWRRAVDELVRERQAVHALKDQLSALRLRRDRIAPVLTALAGAIGLDGASLLPPLPLAQALDRQLALLSERWTESRLRDGERTAIRQRLERLAARRDELDCQQAVWARAFAGAAAAVGLAESATLDMAATVLDLWKALPEIVAERDKCKRRVDGMRRDIVEFEGKVAAMIARAAPRLAGAGVEAAVETLHDLAVAAKGDHLKRAGLLKELELAEERVRAAAGDRVEAETALAALSGSLPGSLPETGDLQALKERLDERLRLTHRLSESRARFQAQAEAASEAGMRAALVDFDRVKAELDIETLQEKEARQIERYGELIARQAHNQRERQALETGVSAEYAVFEKLVAETQAKELARRWVVLKLAATLLSTSMESYREKQADPVMRRAGEHFSVLTGGHFSRLVQEYDEKDELQLLAERRTGERVPLGNLSESSRDRSGGLSAATRDQLLLALRLAFLEDYASRNEPAPLIADDIFQTFDDARAACGLMALAGTSATFQTILFTHQTSVVEIARRELGEAVDLIEL